MRKEIKKALLVAVPATFLTLMIVSFIALPVHAQNIAFDKSNFHDPLKIDNKYFPLKPGTVMIYEGTNEDGKSTRDIFTVTNDTKEIQGITTRVVNDSVFIEGELAEPTDDWYAQDDDGNVWYMGEDTTDLTNKKNPHEGSWEAGVKGARAGIVMLADPKVGDKYEQEFAKGEAEDQGEILSLDESVSVPYGTFSNVLKTKDFTNLEPDIEENKYYAQNIGTVKELLVKGGSEEQTLVQINGTSSDNTGY